jgi:hypothetical protein
MRLLKGSLRWITGWGRHVAFPLLLLAAPALPAQEPTRAAPPTGFGRVVVQGYVDARLHRPVAESARQRVGENLAARPRFTRRGIIIGGLVGCAYGAWKFADAAGEHALGHGVAGCLLLSLPGMFLGGVWIP